MLKDRNERQKNAAAWFWLAAVLCTALQLSFVVNQQLPFIRVAISAALLINFPFLFLRPRWRWTICFPAVAVTLWALANRWYFQSYEDLLPLVSLTMTENFGPFVIEGAFGSMTPKDLGIWLPPILLLAAWIKWRRQICDSGDFTWKFKLVSALAWFAVWLSGQTYGYLSYGHPYNHPETRISLKEYYGRLSSQHLHKYTVGEYGWELYLLHGIWDLMKPDPVMSDEQKAELETFINDNLIALRTDSLTPYFEQRNRDKHLIFIIVESLNADIVGKRCGNQQITPVLDSLMTAGDAVVFNHVQPQVSHGRSIDGLLIYNSGLLPLVDRAWATRYAEADYPSLAKAMGGDSFEVIGEPISVWNHNIVTKSLGFKRYLDFDYHHERDFNIIDSLLMSIAVEQMLDAPLSTYCEVTTLATHDPYFSALGPTEVDLSAEDMSESARNYLIRFNRLDRHFGQFVEKLHETGLYDRSVIVLASDHQVRGIEEPWLSDDVFVIILNAGLNLYCSDPVGQIDIYPTLLQIMGRTDYEWPGLGRSLVAANRPVGSVLLSGRQVGAETDSLTQRQRKAWEISNDIIKSRYFLHKANAME